MYKNFYEVEVGIHLTKDVGEDEYDCYSIRDVTDKTDFAYYDENNVAFFDYRKALDFANDYVKKGIKNTYAFIYFKKHNFTDEQIQSVKDFGTFDYNIPVVPPISEWLYYIYKDKNCNIITRINNGITIEGKNFEKIIKDYEFACQIVKRYDLTEYSFEGLYDLFGNLGYHCYNFREDEFFDIEIGDLILTCLPDYGIAGHIQVWYDEEWHETTVEKFKNLFSILFPQQIELEELKQQYDYECECNKQFTVCQQENENLRTFLRNALMLLNKTYVLNNLKMTEEEYNKIMGE